MDNNYSTKIIALCDKYDKLLDLNAVIINWHLFRRFNPATKDEALKHSSEEEFQLKNGLDISIEDLEALDIDIKDILDNNETVADIRKAFVGYNCKSSKSGELKKYLLDESIPKNMKINGVVVHPIKVLFLQKRLYDIRREIFIYLEPLADWNGMPQFPSVNREDHSGTFGEISSILQDTHEKIDSIRREMIRIKEGLPGNYSKEINNRDSTLSGKQNEKQFINEKDKNKKNVKKRLKKGRPRDTSLKEDNRIYDSWKTGQYESKEELAKEFKKSPRDVKLAIDRVRQRKKRSK